MRRREFIAGLGCAAVEPVVARGQQPERARRIGVVMAYTENDPNGQAQVTAFREQLGKLGWTEGTNLRIDFRYGADDPDRIREQARELLRLAPDLMVSNSNAVTAILQSEVRTIPLVFVSVSDPIGSGFVRDLARPGGNVTGFANFQPTMGEKWLEMLRQIAPQIEHVGFLLHPEAPNIGYLKSAQSAASSFKITLLAFEVNNNRAEIERAFGEYATRGTSHGGFIVAPNVVPFANSGVIVALAARYQLPAIYPFAF